MRALVMREHGDLSVLALVDRPLPSLERPGDVRVSLKAAALNHLDLWTLRGLPGLTLDMPHVLGGDGAGVVEEVGEDVSTVAVGDRVLLNPGVSCHRCDYCRAGEHSLCVRYQLLGEHLPGTLCESIVVPEANVVPIPETPPGAAPVDWTEAAAFSLVTLTAWRMLVTRAGLRPGETVLIWGVGGGVAGAALQIVKLTGAVAIVTSSQDAKLAVAREMGADFTLNHAEVDVAREIRRITDRRGVDVVVDNVGEATWEASLRSLAKLGRLVTCGGTSGPHVVTDVRRLFWNQYRIMGSTMGNMAEFREIVALLGQGHLRPRVDSVTPLSRGIEAFRRLDSGDQMGKLVVSIRD